MIRPVRRGISWRNASPDEPLRSRHPGSLRVRRVPEQEVDAAVAELRERCRRRSSARRRGCGRASSRRCGARARRPSRSRRPSSPGSSGPSARTRAGTGRAPSRRRPARPPSAPSSDPRPCSSSFDLTRPSVRRVPITSPTSTSRRTYGSAADVVLVPVREHDRADGLVEEVREVGQDEVDPEVLVAGEGEPGVDDDAVVAVLEHGHVLADLAEPAERDDPERVCSRSGVYGRSSTAKPPTEAVRPQVRRRGRAARGSRGSATSPPRRPRPAGAAARRPRDRGAGARA